MSVKVSVHNQGAMSRSVCITKERCRMRWCLSMQVGQRRQEHKNKLYRTPAAALVIRRIHCPSAPADTGLWTFASASQKKVYNIGNEAYRTVPPLPGVDTADIDSLREERMTVEWDGCTWKRHIGNKSESSVYSHMKTTSNWRDIKPEKTNTLLIPFHGTLWIKHKAVIITPIPCIYPSGQQ